MDQRKGLSRELQFSLGEKLRELYRTFVQSVPLHFIILARRVGDATSEKGSRPNPISETLDNMSRSAFDPETVEILDEAFEKGWKDLDSLTTNPATQSALAVRLIALLNKGERNPSRLATKAVLELVAARVPDNDP
jgi:hypothetical protein